MRFVHFAALFAASGLISTLPAGPPPQANGPGGEWQLTFTPVSHLLDNNDNFSRDDRFLVVDTRDTFGTGIGNSTAIMKISIATGLENFIYAPYPVIIGGAGSAPGLGAASYSPFADEVVFIHGPFVHETARLGFYGTTNRRGAVAPADGSGVLVGFLDCRDVTSEVTPPGAHRGGTHRHEYAHASPRIGFTYDDALLTNYGRTIGMMGPHKNAPCGASHWTVLLVPMAPTNGAKPGEIERAADDSWVGAAGLMRAFIGRVKEEDGSYKNSLFVVDIPENIDVTTANAGTKTTYPTPPQGVRVRRLTHTEVAGIVRGSEDGTRIAYYATAPNGTRQVYIIPSNGSDRSTDPNLQPRQATFLEKGASGGLRWHPSGNSIAVQSDNGIVAICVQPGPLYGKAYWLTSHGDDVPAVEALVWSRDGSRLAFNRRVPTWDASGNWVKDAGGRDFRQIFLVNFPDENKNGIADPIE